MADASRPGTGGLSHFDLPTIFRCAVELAEAAAGLPETEWADVPANCEGPTSPIFERQMEASRRLTRVEEETERLKRSLGATGPLGHADGRKDSGPKWESYDKRFNNTTHDRVARLALMKLATAAIDLSGFATWREWQWHMRETGLRLLAWGLAQLWEGMSGDERSRVRDRLQRTHNAVSWPTDPAADPLAYDGPEDIPLPYQYRVISNYVSCYREYLNDMQKADNRRVEQGQVTFLRRATLGQLIKIAERAAQALQAMVKRSFDTQTEWAALYTKAFWPLACLRRANEIQPREAWRPDAMEQRELLASAAGILLTWVAGTPEARATYKPDDANKAFEDFTQAIRRLRVIADPKEAKCQSKEAAFSLGMLFDALQRSESAFATKSKSADRVEAEQGSIPAQWWRIQAAALRFQPDPVEMPGIDRIQVLCDELDNGDGLTAANVAKVRAKVCRARPCSLAEANAISLDEAADVLLGDINRGQAAPDEKTTIDRPLHASVGEMADPRSSIATLRDVARREYSASGRTLWLAAYPADLQLDRCEKLDPKCGIVADGRIALPWGAMQFLGNVDMGEYGACSILAFTLPHCSDDEMKRFLSFAADAGAALVAHPPPWTGAMGRPGDAATTWAVGLLFLAPAAANCVVTKSGGCRLIAQPWAASLAALNAWDSTPQSQTDSKSAPPSSQARKRSTERGEGREKLIAALSKHHRYADGSCLNLEPIGNNALAKAACVSNSTASSFFTEEFKGHAKYKALCRQKDALLAALKLLNNEFSPHALYGRRPADEDDRDDDA